MSGKIGLALGRLGADDVEATSGTAIATCSRTAAFSAQARIVRDTIKAAVGATARTRDLTVYWGPRDLRCSYAQYLGTDADGRWQVQAYLEGVTRYLARIYLVAPDQLAAFCADLAAGREPSAPAEPSRQPFPQP